MYKKRIAIDMDQVICDLLGSWLERYNKDYQDSLQSSEVIEWNWHSLTKCGEKIYDYLDDPELFLNLPVIKGSQEIIEKLSQRNEIFIVTAPWNAQNVIPKDAWLRKHFDFIDPKNYVFTKNKSIINADWLIDDKPENLLGFDGYPLLFTAPHNLKENRFHRVNNWEVIGQWFDVI